MTGVERVEQEPDDSAGTVLVIDDNADLRVLFARILQDAGWVVLQAPGGTEGIAVARAELPEVILCDLMMPVTDGLSVLRSLRADAAVAAIPVVMVTASSDTDTVVRCMQAGAHDYLVKTARREELLARCSAALRVSRQHRRLAESERQLLLLAEQLRHQAGHDSLTGLPNRSLLTQRLTDVLAARTDGEPGVHVVYLDLDGFKDVNDTYGHPTGDELLVAVSRRLQSIVRTADTVARIGGDEFVLLLPGIADRSVTRLMHRLEEALSSPFRLRSATVSIGASTGLAAAGPATSAAELLAEADRAMYLARTLTRRVTDRPEDAPPSETT